MTTSGLCTYRNTDHSKSSPRYGNRVCKITPHYMAANWTGRHCADYLAETPREASANYCIGSGGDIAQNVDEDLRAWTSSSAWNDRRAITIECADVDNATGEMTQATWSALVALCVDVCRRYGFRLEYTGDSSGSLTEHRMYAATACPGPWLHERMGLLASAVNEILDGGGSALEEDTPTMEEVDEMAAQGMGVIVNPQNAISAGHPGGLYRLTADKVFHYTNADQPRADDILSQAMCGEAVPRLDMAPYGSAPWFDRMVQARGGWDAVVDCPAS